MCWFMSVWTHAEVLISGSLARLPTKGPTRSKCSRIVGLPTAGLMKDGTPWEDGIFLTFYEALLFLCVYLKGIERFQNGALRRTRRRYLGLFCLLQTFLMNKMSGVKGFFFGGPGNIFAWKPFCWWEEWKSFGCCAGCRKKKTDSIQAAATLGRGRRCRLVCCWDDAEFRVRRMQQELSGSRETTWRGGTRTKNLTVGESDVSALLEKSRSPSTHIGKPLTVDLLLYMSSTSTTTSTSFPHALTV